MNAKIFYGINELNGFKLSEKTPYKKYLYKNFIISKTIQYESSIFFKLKLIVYSKNRNVMFVCLRGNNTLWNYLKNDLINIVTKYLPESLSDDGSDDSDDSTSNQHKPNKNNKYIIANIQNFK